MQFLYLFIALALIAVGAVLAVSPFPMGAVLAVGGLSMLLAVSGRARAWLRRERSRHRHLDEALARAEEDAPETIAGPLERTDGEAAREVHARRAAEKARDGT